MTDRIDEIVKELSELNGTFRQFSKEIEKKMDRFETGQTEVLKSIGAVHIRCSEHLSKIEENKKEIMVTRASLKEHVIDHKEGATSKEKWAIVGAYVLQLITSIFNFLSGK